MVAWTLRWHTTAMGMSLGTMLVTYFDITESVRCDGQYQSRSLNGAYLVRRSQEAKVWPSEDGAHFVSVRGEKGARTCGQAALGQRHLSQPRATLIANLVLEVEADQACWRCSHSSHIQSGHILALMDALSMALLVARASTASENRQT